MVKKSMFEGLDKGAFTAQAKNAGMSLSKFASHVLAKGSKASTKTKKRAVFARTARKHAKQWAKNRKKG